MSHEFKVFLMCRVLKVSRSGYYDWTKRASKPQQNDSKELIEQIKAIFYKSRCTYGFRSIKRDLVKSGLYIGKKHIRRIMRLLGLKAVPLRPNPYSKIKAAEEAKVCKHRLNRQFVVKRANRIWTGDITYIWTSSGWVYLAIVLDLYSRQIVGWSLSVNPDTDLVISALSMAIHSRRIRRWRIMFHSDQGVQYTSGDHRQYLLDRGILQSMSRRGQCWDNAPTESWFGTMKQETGLNKWHLDNIKEVESTLRDWIYWYNYERRHTHLDYCSPVEFENKVAA